MKLKTCGVQAALQVTANVSPQLLEIRTEDLCSPSALTKQTAFFWSITETLAPCRGG